MKKSMKIYIVTGLIMLFIIVSIVSFIKRPDNYSIFPLDAKNAIRSIAGDDSFTDKMKLKSIEKHKNESIYYSSIEEAINIDNQNNEREVVHDEVHRFENNESVILVQVVVVKNAPFLRHNIVFKSDVGFSAPYCSYPFMVTDKYESPRFRKNLVNEDKITDAIKDSFFLEIDFKYANQGKPIYYGVAEDEKIYNLRILGDAPTNIIPFEYDGTTYFYWYYEDASFLEEVRGKVDFSNITLGEIEDILDIHFVQEQ